jgi:hypothetical protein
VGQALAHAGKGDQTSLLDLLCSAALAAIEGPVEANKAQRAEMSKAMRHVAWRTFENGDWLWVARLCTVLGQISSEAEEQVQMSKSHALLELGNEKEALECAQAVATRHPHCHRAKLNLLWITVSASKQDGGEAVLALLKSLLRAEEGTDLLGSLMSLAQMVGSIVQSNDRVLAVVLEESIRVWRGLQKESMEPATLILFRDFDYFSVLVTLMV